MSFTQTLVSKHPVAIIALNGELIDRQQAQQLLDMTNELIEAGQSRIVMELSELKYMNSTGLNAMINVLTKSRKNGGDLVIAGISRKMQELLLVTKLNAVFTVTGTAEEGVRRFNS
ncbi:MAG TPA: STAS domain-containing protein [Bacteroidia bacterium]|nr:STAS domain-containing protein [Bacteroidia bacterium]